MHQYFGFFEPLSSLSHLLAAVLALVLAFPLVKKGRGHSIRVWGLVLFSFSFVFLFSMSGVFHILSPGSGKIVLQRLDHAAIWIMIAASFTPPHLILFRGAWRWGFLGVIWTFAITGLVLKTVFFNEMPHTLGVSLYLCLGWMGIISALLIYSRYGFHRVKWFVSGAFFYTLGAIFEFNGEVVLVEGVMHTHEIFHICVILGAASHWMWIWNIADKPYEDRLLIQVKLRPGSKFYAKAEGEDIVVEANSKDQLLERLRQLVDAKYKDHVPPQAIRLEYINEEFLIG